MQQPTVDPLELIPPAVRDLPVRCLAARVVVRRREGIAPHPASAIRGALGDLVRAACCDDLARPCRDCPARPDRRDHPGCAFPDLFAPSGPSGPRDPPRPWGLEAWWDWPDGDLMVRLWTYGERAADRMDTLGSAFLTAIATCRVDGIPPATVRVQDPDSPGATTLAGLLSPPLPGPRVRVRLRTPLSLKVGNEDALEPPTLDILAAASRRRASLIAGLPSAPRSRGIEPLAPVRCALRAASIRRWSNNQRQAMYLRGLVGWIDYEPVCPEAMAWLLVAEVLGLGRHTTMGFGRIRLEAPAGVRG